MTKVLVAGLLGALALGTAAWAAPTAKLASGAVEGETSGDLVVFKGIPYAASTAGPMRWRAPQPVAPWTGVRPAKAYGPACPQPHLSDDPWAQVGPQSEDCLFLNVWAPAKPAKGGAAVMVFIHGGSLIRGAAGVPLYDGSALARRGVVIVTINYRLGRLGYFAHPALTAENADHGLLGNYGMMDQIAALKWVQANIAALGGDPKKVTVFGESAGGVAVQLLVASPQAKGLFIRAIAESSGGTAVGAPIRGGPITAEPFGVAWASKLGLKNPTPAQLRAAPLAEVINPAGFVNAMVDGELAPQSPGNAFRKGEQLPVALMIGGNSNEASLFRGNTALAKPALGAAYPALLEAVRARGPTKAGAEADLVTQALAIQPSRYLAERQAAKGQPAYAYYFDQVAASERAKQVGADHGGELSYLFGTRIDKEVWDEEDKRVSQLMGDYWVRFAKTGDPNAPGAPRWDPVTRTASPYLVIDAKPHSTQPSALDTQIKDAAMAVAFKAWDAAK
jgi:para-nitrobenzyl esterase